MRPLLLWAFDIPQTPIMPYPFQIDYQNPDYNAVYQWRIDRLAALRRDHGLLRAVKQYYRENPIDLVQDWGLTFDPRALDVGRSPIMPFILFEEQVDWLKWVMSCWKDRENGLSDKSRDMGLTWCASGLSCALATTHNGFVAGFGSRKEDLVDKAGDPDSIFFKVRFFLQNIPPEFRAGWNPRNHEHSSHMRIVIPETGSVIRGEGGKNIGRGGRASMYFVDEAAHLENPQAVETSLSATTNCRIDISSVNGFNNPFAEKRFSGRVRVKTMHWKSDPRKDQKWYDKQREKFNALVVAQEIDIDYSASAEGVLIPLEWIDAAMDAHIKLNIKPTGRRFSSLDVADEGKDMNAFGSRQGILLDFAEQWSGKGSDIYHTAMRAMNNCATLGCDDFQYDSDGMGVSVRGDSNAINALPARAAMPKINAIAFRGSSEVRDKEKQVPGAYKGVKNEDFFMNRKAQEYWALRMRFEQTYRAVVENIVVDFDEIISIDSRLKDIQKIRMELHQPLYKQSTTGKTLIQKTPDGMQSPNYADIVMMLYAPQQVKKGIFG
jgi:phage terminase large subunit